MKFFGSDDAKVDTSDDVLIIGPKQLLEQCSKEDWLIRLTASASAGPSAKKQKTEQAADTPLLSQVIATLAPSADDDDVTTTYVASSGEQGVKKITVAALRTACSRHNTPSCSHAITSIAKKHKSKAGLTVVLLLKEASHALAAGSAVARAYPQYNRKDSKFLGVPRQLPSGLNIMSAPASPDFANTPDEGVSVVFSAVAPSDLPLVANTAHAIQSTCRLVDAPPNELTTDAMVAEACAVAQRHSVTPVVIRGEELKIQGFGGLYGVGKAATNPPALVVLSFFPKGTDKSTKGAVVLVGKGITYDTGGLSIKISGNMPGMKRDMGGAGALLGAWDAAVGSGVACPLHAVLCCAENAVGPVATRPDDVHLMYSSKTVEINNTDAEGRLVLADGVAYSVKHLNPTYLLDMATLTGAQGIATGTHFGAIYCNNEVLEEQAVAAGKFSGDLVHPLPYCPELFRKEFKSAVADMKNSVKNRSNAQSSCAGQFIGNHLGSFQEEGNWLHVDMAYPSFDAADERATGYGVALVQGLLKQLGKL
mmetsp:Transcript_36257/g.71263  ORF Transcript_36257/g.71263 Transcript_36257/m.71263 type:complete len:536 (+) Transcript_36257:43-1650(+)